MRALITCRLVWDSADEVGARLAAVGVDVDIPRFDGQQLGEGDLLPLISNYDGILAGDDHLTRRVLRAGTRLKVISKWGIGVDAIDLKSAAEFGIQVFNTPGVFGEELADYAMGYVHMLARGQHEVNARVKAGQWHKIRGVSLTGKTLGIVGLGSSGRALVKRAAAASMRVLGYDIAETDEVEGCDVVDLETLLKMSDIVTLHLPATPETYHLIDTDSLSLMRDGVWLVNISRGSLVNEDALIAALMSGKVGAAALDVFETEPVSLDNELLVMGNVIVGSHNGSNTHEAVERATLRAVENLMRGLGLDGR